MKICVVGLGYVGATTAVLLAGKVGKNKKIFDIIGLEKNSQNGKKIVQKFNKGVFPFESKDKNILSNLKRIKKKKNLKVTTDKKYLSEVDIIIISLNLELDKNNKKFEDLNFKNTIHDLGKLMKEDALIIIETTVPIGFTRKVVYPIIKKCFLGRGLNPKKINLAHSFERVTPGKNYINSISNSHRVYSGINEKSKFLCKLFLKTFINYKKFPLTELENTDASEFTKILENSFRTVNIAFIEEWRKFSEHLNIDLEKLINAIRLRKTHFNMMMPGLGVGGNCLTKDPRFAEVSSDLIFKRKLRFPITNNALIINNQMVESNIAKVESYFKRSKLIIKKILIFGLSYKENVGDLRNSPSLKLGEYFGKKNYNVYYYDPYFKETFKNLKVLKKFSDIKFFDCIVFCVKHEDFKSINFKKIKIKNNAIIYDSNLVLTSVQKRDLDKKNIFLKKVGLN